jgi:hypothetical protein
VQQLYALVEKGWSEPATTNALVEDEVVQVVLRMNQKTHPLPLPRDFSTPFSAPKSSPPTYILPAFLPTPLLPPSPHFLFTPSRELTRADELQRQKLHDIRLEEGGELNIAKTWKA